LNAGKKTFKARKLSIKSYMLMVRFWDELSSAVTQAMHLCLRISQVSWGSGAGIDDGAGLPAVILVNIFLIY